MILVIDDEEGIRELIEAYLSAYKGEVHTAKNVPEALKLLQTNNYEVVVCDLVLGSGHGNSVFSYMRKPKSPHNKTPVLFISGHQSGPKDQDDFSSFLSKPFSEDEFLQAIKDLIRKTKEPQSNSGEDGAKTKVGLHPDLKKILGGKG